MGRRFASGSQRFLATSHATKAGSWGEGGPAMRDLVTSSRPSRPKCCWFLEEMPAGRPRHGQPLGPSLFGFEGSQAIRHWQLATSLYHGVAHLPGFGRWHWRPRASWTFRKLERLENSAGAIPHEPEFQTMGSEEQKTRWTSVPQYASDDSSSSRLDADF